VGPSITTELQNVVSKVNRTCTYPTSANYWAPLSNEDDDEDQETCYSPIVINNISDDAEARQAFRSTIQSWIDQRIHGVEQLQTKASTMILDSGATSHFMRAEEELPVTGISTKGSVST